MIARGRWGVTLLAALTTLAGGWVVSTLLDADTAAGPTFLAVVVVALVGGLARTARLPRWLVVLAQTTVAALVVSWVLLPGHHRYGLPAPSIVDELGRLTQMARTTIETEISPVTTNEGMVLLTVVALALVAVAVDALAVTYARPVAAGLPLLVVGTVCASNNGTPQDLWYFVAPALCWLALIAQQGRGTVRTWAAGAGGTWNDDMAVRPVTRRFATHARVLGVSAVALAVALPVLLPHLPPSGLVKDLTTRGPGGGGVTFTETLDLAADLGSRSTDPVLVYTSDDPTATPLRVVVSTTYADGRWQPLARGRGPAPEVPAVVPAEGVAVVPREIEVTYNSIGAPQVAVPYPLVDVDFGGIAWAEDLETGVVAVAEQPGSYRAVYTKPVGRLPGGVGDLGASFPGSPDLLEVDAASAGVVAPLAAELTAGSVNQVQAARAIQEYLRGQDFTYSLTLADPVQGPDGNPLDPLGHFLATKQGYCVQFASAMIMLSRAVGIPARLGVGFLAGEEQEDGSRVVLASDAHAWPELYLDGLGWTRFEPTPGVRTGTAPVYLTEADLGDGLATADPGTQPERPDTEPVPGSAGAGTTDAGLLAEILPVVLSVLAGLVLLGGLASVVPLAGRWRRAAHRRRARDDAAHVEGEWQVLVATLADLGVSAPVSATPRQSREHYDRSVPLGGAAVALERAADRVERARYAPGRVEVGTMVEDVHQVTSTVRSVVPGRARLRAVLWPASGTAQVRDVVARARAGVRGWIDRLGASRR